MRMTAAIITAGLGAGQASALVPLPECHDPGAGDYIVGWHDGGFVAYAPWDDEAYRIFLDDCGGGQRLVMSIAHDQSSRLDVVWTALESRQRYTMGRIAGLAREAGAVIDRGRAGYESCACAKYGG